MNSIFSPLQKPTIQFINLATLVLLGGAVFAGCTNQNQAATNDEVNEKQVKVQVIAPQDKIVTTLNTSGTIVPKQYARIRSLVQGTVEYVAPIGSQVTAGTPLFRLRNESIESSYFNSQQNLEQTKTVSQERVTQAKLALSSAQARLELAGKNLATAEQQTDQNLRNTQDTALVTYTSAYNTLSQFFNFVSVGTPKNIDFRFKKITTSNLERREQADVAYTTAVKAFLALLPNANRESLENYLSNLASTLELSKTLADITVVVLQETIGGLDNPESIKTTMASYQTQINTHTSVVLSSQNALQNTNINNNLSITQAENQLELAEIEYQNAQVAFENAQSSAELERTISQNQLSNAAYNFSNLSLTSPFQGTIISRTIEPGQQVSAGQEMLELGDLNIVEIQTSVDTEFAGGLSRGDAVRINGLYDGIISDIEPVGSRESGKVGVRVQADNAQNFLVAGDIAEVNFTLTHQEPGLIVIPINAASIESTQSYVFVIEDGRAVKREVSLGRVFGNKVSVTKGLAEGEMIILRNGVFISNGEEVEVVE